MFKQMRKFFILTVIFLVMITGCASSNTRTPEQSTEQTFSKSLGDVIAEALYTRRNAYLEGEFFSSAYQYCKQTKTKLALSFICW